MRLLRSFCCIRFCSRHFSFSPSSRSLWYFGMATKPRRRNSLQNNGTTLTYPALMSFAPVCFQHTGNQHDSIPSQIPRCANDVNLCQFISGTEDFPKFPATSFSFMISRPLWFKSKPVQICQIFGYLYSICLHGFY